MEDKIFMKKIKGGIWEKNPHVAFAIILIVGTPLLIVTLLLVSRLIDMIFPEVLANALNKLWALGGLVLLIGVLVTIVLHCNQKYNMSKSLAFIQRDGKLYAVQLLYAKQPGRTPASRAYIYMPAGTIAQAAALPHNIKVARDVQVQEKEVRERRKEAESFLDGLDDILEAIKANPSAYNLRSNENRNLIDNAVTYNVVNNGLASISTEKANYKFLILNAPEIVKQNNSTFTINFYNENKELCSAKFSNCYGNILDGLDDRMEM